MEITVGDGVGHLWLMERVIKYNSVVKGLIVFSAVGERIERNEAMIIIFWIFERIFV